MTTINYSPDELTVKRVEKWNVSICYIFNPTFDWQASNTFFLFRKPTTHLYLPDYFLSHL